MADFKSPQVDRGYTSMSVPSAGVVMCAVGTINLTLAQAQAIVNDDQLLFCKLPAEHVLVDAYLDTDDLDGAAGLVVDAGLLDAAGTGIGATEKFISASTTFQAPARVQMKHPASSALGKRQKTDRTVAAKITTKPATPLAGRATMVIFYRAAEYGDAYPS